MTNTPTQSRRNELWNVDNWRAASEARQNSIVAQLLETQSGLEAAYDRSYAGSRLRIVTLRDKATGLLFNLIPGGSFEMGLSDHAEDTLRGLDTRSEYDPGDDEGEYVEGFLSSAASMRPVREVMVPPFLLARFPLTLAQANKVVDLDPTRRGSLKAGDAALADLFKDEVKQIAEASGCRLPAEAEWEYACRAGTTTLFPWGNEVPDAWEFADRAGIPEEADDWATAFENEEMAEAASNRFGLVSMGAAVEWCADAWHTGYDGAPKDGSAWLAGVDHVVRGGGAQSYPWQGCGEWLVMLSASRARRSERAPAVLRLARDV